MTMPLQMKQSVDKEKEEVFGVCVVVLRSFLLGNRRAENDLTALTAHAIRKYVRYIGLVAERAVEFLRTSFSRNDDGDVPSRQYLPGDVLKRQTGHTAPGKVSYIYRCHWLLPSASLLCGWVNLPKLHELVVLVDALCTDEGACMVHVLGLLAGVVAASAHATHEVKSLRAAGESADK